MQLIRNGAQPQSPTLGNVSDAILNAYGSGKGPEAIDESLKGSRAQRLNDLDRQTAGQKDIMSVMKDLRAQGDADVEAVDKAISRFAGDNPESYQKLLTELHNDPEPVNRMNAVTKAAMAASKLGIRKPSPQVVGATSRLVDTNTGKVILGPDPAYSKAAGGRGTEFERLVEKMNDGTASPAELRRLNTIARGGKDTFESETQKSAAKEVKDLRIKSESADQLLGTIQMAREASKNVTTGPLIGRAQTLTPEGQTLNGIYTKMALDAATALKGAVSNYEDKLVQSTKPSLTNYNSANESIMKAHETAAQRIIEHQNFVEAWANNNGGNLAGSEAAWGKFIDDNPVLVKTKDGGLAVNEANIRNWDKYLSSGVPTKNQGIKAGHYEDGYLFLGGDPGDRNNWEKAETR